MKSLQLIIVLSFISILSYPQGSNIYYKYTGNASASDILGHELYTLTKTGGGDIAMAYVTIQHTVTSNIENNIQSVSSHNIICSPSVTIPLPQPDLYGNQVVSFEVIGPLSVLQVEKTYTAYTDVNIPAFFFLDGFPLPSGSVPADILVYLSPTTKIQSNNSSILAEAQSITTGCMNLTEAVEEIAKWVRGNITYMVSVPQDAVSVYNNRTGNCEGFTNLSIAFLRSLGIPVRYVSGFTLPGSYQYPFPGGAYIAGGGLAGAHAIHEIYYPSIDNWVRGDGQGTVHYTNQNFIKEAHGPDTEATGFKVTFSYSSGSPPPQVNFSRSINTTIGSVFANYSYVSHHNFGGSNSGEHLFAVDNSAYPVGIYDDVEITEGTANFSPGNIVSFTADFTSGWGDTYATEWDWTMILHHTGGTYLYHEGLNLPDLGNQSIWNFTSSLSLPNYDWVRDFNGNIYGLVQATSTDNNGEYNTGEFPISINYKPSTPQINILNHSNSSINLEYHTIGATAYDIFYGNSDLFDSYAGTYAFEGNSPIDVDENTSFTLSNLESPTYITLKATNAYGESDLADPIAFCEYARLPYTTGFESGLDKYWSTKRDKSTNRVTTTSSYSPHGGSSHLIMDGTPSQYYTNSADLHLNLKNEKNVLLDFWWKEFGDETHSQDGIYISNDGGINFVKIYDFEGSSVTNNTWKNIILDLRDLAIQSGFSLSDLFVVRFQQYDNYAITTDGFAFDDISVYCGISSSASKDALLCLNQNPSYLYMTDHNYGSDPHFYSNEWTHGGYKTTKRSLIDLNISEIPPGAIIENAELSLYAYNDSYYNNWHMNFSLMGNPYIFNASYLKRITEPWDENTVTWNNQPSTTSQSQASLNESTSHGENYLNIDITQLVQEMVEDPDNSFGLMLILQSELNYAQLAFCSSDHPDESKHPQIYINYSIPTLQTSPFSTSKDAMVLLHTKPGYEYCANTNYGTYDRFVADEWTSSGYRTNKNSLIDFDLSSIPTTAVVTEALINLRACNPQPNDEYKQMSNISTGDPGFKPNASWLRKIITPWDENQVTYNTQPVTSEIDKVYLKTSETYNENYLNIDITDLIQDKISNPSNNFGILLDLYYGEKYARMVFASSDHSDNSLHPELILNYYNTEKVYQIPFTKQGYLCDETDDWDVQSSDGKDKAFLVYLPNQNEIEITLCSALTDYDTKLEIFNLDRTTTGLYNDDYDDCTYDDYHSAINGVLSAGYYYIVVDGYGGDCGNYELSVTVGGGLKSANVNEENITTGNTEKAIDISKLLIYPNPAHDVLMVKSACEIQKIKIVDLSGRIIFVTDRISNSTLEINTAEFSPGVYMIFVYTIQSKTKQKFIISR